MNKNKLVIIFAIFLFSFVIGGGCFFYFHSNKDKELNLFKKNALKIAKRDIFLFSQKLSAYRQKIIDEKKACYEDLEKNIEILKDQGIWEGKKLKFDKGYKEYLDAFQGPVTQDALLQVQLDLLLKNVEKEKNLEIFRKGLEKIGEEYKKKLIENMEKFVKLTERIQKEAKKPMPFLVTWVGLVSFLIIALIFYYVIFYKIFMYFKYVPKNVSADEKSYYSIFVLLIMMIGTIIFYFFMAEISVFVGYLLASKKDYKDKIYFTKEVNKFITNNYSKNSFFILVYCVIPLISGIITMNSYVKNRI